MKIFKDVIDPILTNIIIILILYYFVFFSLENPLRILLSLLLWITLVLTVVTAYDKIKARRLSS